MANKQRFTESNIKSFPTESLRYRVWDTLKPNLLIDVLPSGKKVFRLYFRHNGKPRFNTIGAWGAITLEQARALSTTQLGEAAKGIDLVDQKREVAREETHKRLLVLETFLDEKYTPWATSNLKSGTESIKTIRRNFSWLLATPMNKITVSALSKWQHTELKRELKPATINRTLATLRGVLTKAVEHGLLPSNPIAKVKDINHPEETRIRYLSKTEEKRLRLVLQERNDQKVEARLSGNQFRAQRGYSQMKEISGYSDHLEPLTLLAMNTGMRRGELFQLTWNKVDLINKILTVAATTAKSRKVRHIPLNNEAMQVLTTLNIDHSRGLVFPNPETGKPLTTIKTAWWKIVETADITDFRFHDLRHHFASKLVMAGIDLNTVRELLGHANLEMTLRYAHLAPEHKAQAVAVLNQ